MTVPYNRHDPNKKGVKFVAIKLGNNPFVYSTYTSDNYSKSLAEGDEFEILPINEALIKYNFKYDKNLDDRILTSQPIFVEMNDIAIFLRKNI